MSSTAPPTPSVKETQETVELEIRGLDISEVVVFLLFLIEVKQ